MAPELLPSRDLGAGFVKAFFLLSVTLSFNGLDLNVEFVGRL